MRLRKLIINLKNFFSVYFLPLLAFVILLIIWQTLCNIGIFETWLLPSPGMIIKELYYSKVFLIEHTFTTALEVLLGLSLAIIFGTTIGFLMSSYKFFERSILPYVIASQVIPIFALAPILIVWFGAGLISKIIVVFLISFFPIVIGVFDGLKTNSIDMENMLRTMGANNIQIFKILKIKLALPSFFSGIKVASVSSVIGAVVAEWIGSKSGLGWIMKVSGPLFQTERVFASIVILSIFASILFLGVKFLENKLVKG
ncbi:MAG: nitrate ABC transporter permease [Chloroflexi bacterium]|nr:nitrate ABC transporter permease [Chloroflexota bacterium]|tara:strand:+ start:3035 stop:3805 length:771 start_codon:yes stop_codon:yes gene_type:complete